MLAQKSGRVKSWNSCFNLVAAEPSGHETVAEGIFVPIFFIA